MVDRKVGVVRESVIRENACVQAIVLLDQWHVLFTDLFGDTLEVVITSPEDMPLPADFPDTTSTGGPMVNPDLGTVMNLIIANLEEGVDDLVWTHELGHWILFLQGFSSAVNQSTQFWQINSHFNSVSQHTPLSRLQQSVGLDPQSMFDERASANAEAWAKTDESETLTPHPVNYLANALRASDDLLLCSTEIQKDFEAVLKSRYPKTWERVEIILETARHYDLAEKESNRKFQRRLIRNLNLGDGWEFPNYVAKFAEEFRERRNTQ